MKDYTIITGSSSGIGYELANLFAEDKHNIILVARNEERLQIVKDKLRRTDIDIKILALDLANMDDCNKLIKFVEENNIDISILVNNAGVGSFGDFKDIEWNEEEKLIDINIKALTKLTKYFLPKMIDKKRGGILNVASTAAFASGPRMATYYASKAYVLNLTEAIYEEVKGTGVKVSCLCPGPVKTSFQDKAGIKKSENAKKYLMDAQTVAKEGYYRFKKGKLIIIPGFKNRILVNINKLMPRFISRKIILNTNIE